MTCRIGITTNLAARKKYWERKHGRLDGWTIIGTGLTKSQAQQLEIQKARDLRCRYGVGGDDPDSPGATWSVYYFRY